MTYYSRRTIIHCILAGAFMAAGGGTLSVLAWPQEVAQTAGNPAVQEVADMYKAVKQLQFDGAEEARIYEEAYNATLKAAQAIQAPDIDDAAADQCRGMLQDLSSLLARASVSCSMKGDNAGMTKYATQYVDILMMPQMAVAQVNKDPELYPALVYCAASGAYNAGKVDDAIRYFEEYLATGQKKNREQVSLFYGQSLLQTKQPGRGADAVVAASNDYPANNQLLTIAMQLCLDAKKQDLLPPLLDRALTFKPNDEKLLNLKAQVDEGNGKYREALDIYLRLDEAHPNSLNIAECIARCYYNLATAHYNEAITSTNEKDAARSRRQSNAYFGSAAEKFEELSANDPNNVKYLKGMATSYAILGNKSKVDNINVRLQALGESPMAMNTMPVVMGDQKAAASSGPRQIPSYQQYAEQFVSAEMAKWAQRGEFEKVDDYTKRLSPEGILAEQKRLSAITADDYLKKYASHLVLNELKLQPYDVENETYAVNSDFGPVYVKVPLKNKEAELFKTQWEKVQIRNAKFFIKDDRIAISTITFHTPAGKDYTYNASAALAYEPPVVNVDTKLFAVNNTAAKPRGEQQGAAPKAKTLTVQSDVDKDIPTTKSVNANSIALVISNEHYNKVSPVECAEHDGDVFAQYCHQTLGIPDNQVLRFKDVTYGNILSAVNQLKNSVSALGGTPDVIVYYAGHGVPDESTKDAYMLPVDADPQVMATAYPLAKFYEELGNMGAGNVMVFMDACFSGANRGDGMLASARGVALKPKTHAPQGNMFVLSAADGNETALPWTEKNHGLFTYWLLKKLQESKGNATLAEIAEFVEGNVKKTSSFTLNKPQTPVMKASGQLFYELDKKKLK